MCEAVSTTTMSTSRFYASSGRRRDSPQYQSTPTSSRSRGYQPGMGLHQQDFLDFEESDEDTGTGQGGCLLQPSSFLTPERSLNVTQNNDRFNVAQNCDARGLAPVGRDNISMMLQQQQGLLSQILQNQDSMEKKQNDFQSKLLELETKINSPANSSSPDTDSVGRRKE